MRTYASLMLLLLGAGLAWCEADALARELGS
jgi:hypothetical protein